MNDLIDIIVDAYKADPRNKIFVTEELLLVSVKEETGSEVTSELLRSVIGKYLNGEMSGDDESIYDGAVYACAVAARKCFGEDPEEDIDYQIEWLENEDGSYIAEVSPS